MKTLKFATLALLSALAANADSFDVRLIATTAFQEGEPVQLLQDMEAIFTTDGLCEVCTVVGATASGGTPSTVVADGVTSFVLSPPNLLDAQIYLYNFFSDATEGQTWGSFEYDRQTNSLTADLGNWGSDLTQLYPDGTWHNDGDGSRDTFGVYVINTPLSVGEPVPEPGSIVLLGLALLTIARQIR